MNVLASIACPLCNNESSFYSVNVPDGDSHIRKYGKLYDGCDKSEWKVCGRCGFVHQNRRPTIEALNEFYLAAQYHEKRALDERERYMEFANWYYKEKVSYALRYAARSPGKVFEVGLGQGGALRKFADQGWECYGVEADSELYAFAKNDLGLEKIKLGLMDPDVDIGCQVDLVFSNHAFEHFADLDQVMKGIQKIIKPGGLLFTAVPTYYKNRSSLSKQWLNSAHYSMFTHKSLNQLLSHYGFEEITHSYRGWKKEVDDLWHLARYTGKSECPERFWEHPRKVARYLNIINPMRSVIYYPLYSHYASRVRLYASVKKALSLFITSPRLFFTKLHSRVNARQPHI